MTAPDEVQLSGGEVRSEVRMAGALGGASALGGGGLAPSGPPGVGVERPEIGADGHLRFYLTDGTVADAGALPSATRGGYVHLQVVPATTWTVAHNLGYWPDVATYTPGGLALEGTVLNLSLNVLTVEFLTPQAGAARLS